MKTLLLSTMLVLIGTVAGATHTAERTTAASTLTWSACGDGLQCSSLSVPLDHSDPGGVTIDIALARLPAADASTRIGSLLINPGGPGGSGVGFLRAIASQPPAAWHDNFDIVGFDPRGAGDSEGVDCIDDVGALLELDPSPDTSGERSDLYDAYQQFADDCEQNNDALRFIDTISAARDIDLIRVALDEEKITYFGYSYGTILGATYAGLFPQHVRAFVLDGAVDPALSAQNLVIEQARGFESALTAFLADCAAREDCAYNPAGDIGVAFDALIADIEETPLDAEGDTRTVTEGIALTGVAAALYDQESGWPFLADALNRASTGDGGGLLFLADLYLDRMEDGTYSNLIEAYFAITCLDEPFPTGIAGYEGLLPRIIAAAPRMGHSIAVGTNLPCAFWPVPATGDPAPIAAAGAPPIVVVGTTNDPATPYSWAQSLAGQLQSGVLLTRVGEGHTAYEQGSSCIDDALDTYIVTLQPPADGTTCQQDGVAPPPAATPVASPVAPTATPRSIGISAPDTGTGGSGNAPAPLLPLLVAATLALTGAACVVAARR